ncbi:hypothetical protein BDV32DRAFT_140477 [Aspergillus pseudonomiae]|nr:hypothetical protein BDV32DRAFT_140477 [Aspergillus pseudonomiae]
MVYINHTKPRGLARATSVSHDHLCGTTLGCSGDGSAGSSATSLRSSSVATSSASSREILVGLGISTTPLGLKVEDYQLPITPRPSHGYCIGDNSPSRHRNQLDKPLPPLPLGAKYGPPKHRPLPPRPQGREHWSLPNKPEAHDLAALDRAFASRGLLSNHQRHLPVHRHLRDLPQGELIPDRLTPRHWIALGRTLARIFQQFRRPRLPHKLARAVPEAARPVGDASTQLPLRHMLSTTTGRNGPPIDTDGAVTRMQRILSLLLESRAFLSMSNMVDEDRERYEHDFIEQAELLLPDYLQPTLWTSGSGSHAQGPSSTAGPGSTGPIAPMPQPRHSIQELDVRSRASSLPCAKSTLNVPISIMLQILQQVNCLEDLFSLAQVNRVAYKAFKAHELPLIQRTLWQVSPPAWELRQVSEVAIPYAKADPNGSPLAAIVRDEMMEALCNTGSEWGAAVDDAIWRVWTFCYLFGSRKGRECDFVGQIRWLRGQTCSSVLPQLCCTSPDPSDFNTVLFTPPDGFARGNQGPLSEEQLCDMVEIWTAMATLLDFLRAQTPHARRYGVFDDTGITPGDKQQEEFMLSRFPLVSFGRPLTHLAWGI